MGICNNERDKKRSYNKGGSSFNSSSNENPPAKSKQNIDSM